LCGDRWQPAVDIFETASAVVVRVELSGVRGDDLRVNVDGDLLRITGVRRVPGDAGVRRLHQMEIAFGPFERVIRLGDSFDREGVTAHLEEGFLEVTLPSRVGESREVEVERE
jgi:HSP20 family protein